MTASQRPLTSVRASVSAKGSEIAAGSGPAGARHRQGLALGALPLFLGLLLCPAPARARVQATESDIKAAFLYNFTKYIEWPAAAFRSADEPFRVCVLADDSFTQTVRAFMSGEVAQGRPIQLVIPRQADLPSCQILFVGPEAAMRERPLIAGVANRPVLTVGETPQFLETGGIVRFQVVDEHVRFDVHLAAASRAGLKISSKLLRVAREVREGSTP